MKNELTLSSQENNEVQPPAAPQVYYGPNIKGGQLRQYTVFKNGISKHIQELIKENPLIGAAVVDASEFPRILRALTDKTSPEAATFEALKGAI